MTKESKIEESTLEQIAESREHLESIENLVSEIKMPKKLKVELEGVELLTIKGDKGDMGIDGKVGNTGPKGDKGDIGPEGKEGKEGKVGKQGKTGKDGKQGIQGNKGKQGDQGEKGDQGEHGSSDTPIEIRDKLELLDGNYRLDAKAIKNLPLVISNSVKRDDHKVKVSANDTVPDYLTNKLVAGSNITLTTTDNGDEDITIAATVPAEFISSVTDTTSVDLTVAAGALSATVLPAGVDHGGLAGLADDDHSQYFLLAGRSGGQIAIGGTAATDDLTLRTTAGVGAAGADMIFQVGNNGATEVMRILNSGNIGIGDTAPDTSLTVNVLSKFTRSIHCNSNNFYFHGGHTSFGFVFNSVGDLLNNVIMLNSGTLKIRNKCGIATGNMTSEPSPELEVGSGATDALGTDSTVFIADGTSSYVSIRGGANPNLFLGSDSSTYAIIGTIGADSPIGFRTNNVLRATLSSTGFGIGVATPTAAIDIKAGTTTVSPLKFASGTNLTTPENGAMEYNGTRLFFTPTVATRQTIMTIGKGTDVASGADITLGTNGNFFDITGVTTINTISATNWQAGSIIVLQFDGSLTVAHNTAGTGASILLAGAANFSATANDTLTLIYDGVTWRELARTAI